METELTKKIKKACVRYKPNLNTTMRTIRYAEEVWTPTGIVDVIRFEDYVAKDRSFCRLIDYNSFCASERQTIINMAQGKEGYCKIKGKSYPNKCCSGCVWHSHIKDIDMLITCFEVKISVSDFKSKNGHNFHGNKNYYVVASDIYDAIKDLVPEDIGIIVYYESTGSMRTKKESVFKSVDEVVKSKLLYDALKKWCDGIQTLSSTGGI